MQATRRTFFGWMTATPLAAKAAADAEITKLTAMRDVPGFGDAAVSLGDGIAFGDEDKLPYRQRVIGAADYIKTFGIPPAVEARLRNDAKYVHALDPDIACMRSWSMSFKIHCQRQRNYERALEAITTGAKHERAKKLLKGMLGFEWPW
jgi:hypothetical protein